MSTRTSSGRASHLASIPEALAAAWASAPVAWAVALVGSAVASKDAVWATCAGFAAGAALCRAKPAVRVGTIALLAVLLLPMAGHVYAWMSDATIPQPFWSWRLAASPPRDFASAVAMTLLAVLAALRAGGIGVIPWAISSAWPVVVLVFVVPEARDLTFAAGALTVACLASRASTRAALVAAAATFAVALVLFHVIPGRTRFLATIVGGSFLVATLVAGRTAAALRDGAAGDGGARLVVFAQRRPWLTSVACVGVTVLVARSVQDLALWFLPTPLAPFVGTFRLVTFSGPTDSPDPVQAMLVLLPLVPAMVSFTANVGLGGRAPWDRFARWAVTSVAVLAVAWRLATKLWLASNGLEEALLVTAPIGLWPLAAEALLSGRPHARESRSFAIVSVALLALASPILAAVARPAWTWECSAAITVLLVPLAFQAVVRSSLRTRTVLLVAPLLGAVSLDWTSAAVWTACALLAVAARRARSMTAVPLDHPVVEDFGGE